MRISKARVGGRRKWVGIRSWGARVRIALLLLLLPFLMSRMVGLPILPKCKCGCARLGTGILAPNGVNESNAFHSHSNESW